MNPKHRDEEVDLAWLDAIVGEDRDPDPNDLAALAWGGGTEERRRWTRSRLLSADPAVREAHDMERELARQHTRRQRRTRLAIAAVAVPVLLLLALHGAGSSEEPSPNRAPEWVVAGLTAGADASWSETGTPWDHYRPIEAEELASLTGLGTRAAPRGSPTIHYPRGILTSEPDHITLAGAEPSTALELRDASDGRSLGRIRLDAATRDRVSWPAEWVLEGHDGRMELQLRSATGRLLHSSTFDLARSSPRLDRLQRRAERLPRPLAHEALANALFRLGYYDRAHDELTAIAPESRTARQQAFLEALAHHLGR